MFSLIDEDTFFLMPVAYHPRTVMLVDDDQAFLKQLALQLSEHTPVITFSNPDEAILHLRKYYAALKDCWLFQTKDSIEASLEKSRRSFYSTDRFQGISTVVLDYEMPNKDGFAMVVETDETALRQPSYHHMVLLTAKRFSDFDSEFADFSVAKNYISKWDPKRIEQLLNILADTPVAFRWMSYSMVNKFSLNTEEKPLVFRDGNFLPVLNETMKAHNLCEFTLFDRQGSLMFLDDQGRPSWLFVRNETGMENSLKLAEKLNAPLFVMDALESKKAILSLYEESDYGNLDRINWNDYLLPLLRLDTDLRFLGDYTQGNPPSPYYYAYTNQFPAFELDKSQVVSYKNYLDSSA